MVKRALGREPLLRRPFSVFEILRNAHGAVTGLSLLSKQVGTVTRDLFEAEPGERIRCLGPLGTPFSVGGPADPRLDGRRRSRPGALRHADRGAP